MSTSTEVDLSLYMSLHISILLTNITKDKTLRNHYDGSGIEMKRNGQNSYYLGFKKSYFRLNKKNIAAREGTGLEESRGWYNFGVGHFSA